MPFKCSCGRTTHTVYINGRGEKWCEKCEDKDRDKKKSKE